MGLLKFSIKILKFLKEFFLLEFFVLHVMVLPCVVVKSCMFSFQLHQKKKIHNDRFFAIVWIRDIGCIIFYNGHLGLNIYSFGHFCLGLKDQNVGFNFSSHFCHIFQIDLYTMHQYLIHSENFCHQDIQNNPLQHSFTLFTCTCMKCLDAI